MLKDELNYYHGKSIDNSVDKKSFTIIRWWRGMDQQIVIALAIIFAFSLMLVTTSSPAVASRIGLDEHYFSSRQPIYLVLGVFLIAIFSSFDLKWLKRAAIIGFIINLLLLVLVKFFGYEVKGAIRWINIFGFSMQPSEFIKPFFAIVTGWIMSLKFENKSKINKNFPSATICIVLYLIVALLIIIQPDFGMLVMITAGFGIQLFVSGMPLLWIIFSIIFSGFGVICAYFWLPHVTKRINSFLDPSVTENYQVSKSIMAFQQGGLYGRGPGEGSVKQVLPDSHTDFIFAVAGEEFGAIICLIIICVFAFIILKSMIKLMYEEDKFVQLAGIGIIAQFALQSIINMGVALNLLPTKGMTLPFISYGGCSTLSVSIAIGMLLGFLKQRTSTTKYRLQLDI